MHSDDCFDIVGVGGWGREECPYVSRAPQLLMYELIYPAASIHREVKHLLTGHDLSLPFIIETLIPRQTTLIPVKRLASELSLMLEANSGIRYRQ